MILDRILHKNSSILATALVAAVIVLLANGIPYLIRKSNEEKSLDALIGEMDFSEANVRPRMQSFAKERIAPVFHALSGVPLDAEEEAHAADALVGICSPDVIRFLLKMRVLDYAAQKGWDDRTLRRKLVKADPQEIREMREIPDEMLRRPEVQMLFEQFFYKFVPWWTIRHPEFRSLVPAGWPKSDGELRGFLAASFRCRSAADAARRAAEPQNTGLPPQQLEKIRLDAFREAQKKLPAEQAETLGSRMTADLNLSGNDLWAFALSPVPPEKIAQWLHAHGIPCLPPEAAR